MPGEDQKELKDVTMRVRIGGNEIEVTGPSDFVERKIEEFINQSSKFASRSPSPSAEPISSPSPEELPEELTKIKSVAQFFRRISSKTDVDRVLAAGYFLEKLQNQDRFTANEVKETIRSAKIPPPKNPNDSLNKNIKKGFIMPAGDKEGKMSFVLTSDGEEAIAELVKT